MELGEYVRERYPEAADVSSVPRPLTRRVAPKQMHPRAGTVRSLSSQLRLIGREDLCPLSQKAGQMGPSVEVGTR